MWNANCRQCHTVEFANGNDRAQGVGPRRRRSRWGLGSPRGNGLKGKYRVLDDNRLEMDFGDGATTSKYRIYRNELGFFWLELEDLQTHSKIGYTRWTGRY
jgi:hypothetical protein